MSEKPHGPEHISAFSDVLSPVMSDPDYLAGSEPEGSNWDFRGWPGYDFREYKSWVLAEKFFVIPTVDGRQVAMRIIDTDPDQFSIDIDEENINVSYVLTPLVNQDFPVIFIGRNQLKDEVIARRQTNTFALHELPNLFEGINRDLGELRGSSVVVDRKGDQWAEFMKLALKEKKVMPAHFGPTDSAVKDRLELTGSAEITEDMKRLAEMEITQEELIMYAYSDFMITSNC